LNNLRELYCENNPIYDIVANNIEHLKILNRFNELFYLVKYRKQLRNFYYERVLRPRIETKYHPNNLISLIEGKQDYDAIVELW
jgi:hypothetical protein